jgi:CDP-diacylglycerol---serine O-phosphatidyltransferase
MRSWIPNSITLGNLLMGCLAIVLSTSPFNNRLELGMTCIVIAAVLDFFDGLVARALGVSSALGAQLDSLADVVSFGVVPAIWVSSLLPPDCWCRFIPFIMALGAAYRLARFNLDTNAMEHFKGLPVPASAMIWIAIIGLHLHLVQTNGVGLSSLTLHGLSFITTGLMVSTLPLLNLKFKGWVWKGQEIKWLLLLSFIGVFTLVPLLGYSLFLAILISMTIYLILSISHYKKFSS